MNELLYKTLKLINLGVIILDDQHKIVFFSNKIEKLCNIPEKKVLGKKIEEVLPVFSDAQYSTMIDVVLCTGQSRFCSSALHKSFVFPKGESRNSRRQNMRLEFISSEGKQYVIIQIIDISETFNNELLLKDNIIQLKKGIEDLNFTKAATERMAKYDVLTGLLNRYYFEIKFNEMIQEAEETNERFALLFIDIDGFKIVNDELGHMIGDGILQLVSGRLKNNIRSNGFIMRMGGDEFVVAQKNTINISHAVKIAHNLLEILRKPYYIDGKVINISASIGVSIYPDHAKNLTELISKADKAMYYTKKHGKNRVQLYNDSL
ncbi:MAG: diguanylate cyclase [Bacillota bacterium]|nr:diguanylate cyclase [Bacillota bacterium]